jgi:quinol-cytochrome oxidoreductase complex cytochrome b subunit
MEGSGILSFDQRKGMRFWSWGDRRTSVSHHYRRTIHSWMSRQNEPPRGLLRFLGAMGIIAKLCLIYAIYAVLR